MPQLKNSRFVEIGTRRQILYVTTRMTSCMILDPRAWNLAPISALAVCRAQASLEDPKGSGLFSHGTNKVKLVCLYNNHPRSAIAGDYIRIQD